MGLLNYIKETWQLNKAFYESERQESAEDEPAAITLEDPHEGEELVTYDGVTFWAPKPMTQDDYQKMRQQQIDWLENYYDLNSAAGIQGIPEINPPKIPGYGPMDVTGDIDYYLHSKAYSYEEAGNIDLAILCLKKSNAIRRRGRVAYRKDDYYALVKMLARNGRVEEAYAEKARIDRYYPKLNLPYEIDQVMLDQSIKDEIRRGEEARAFKWLQQNLPAICPKTLSGFRRMKTQNTKNYQKIVTEARKLGYEI